MSTRHIAAEDARLSDLTPQGSSGRASKRFRQRLAADGFTVDEGFRLKPGYLYTVVRAISARVNQNYDGWPSDELKKSYKTFIGKPVFVNHENHDPTKARGVVVAARYVENGPDRYIEVVQEVDAERFPKLAHEIKTGGLDSVSMGAEAGFTICSYCHNKATDLDDMCDHVRNHKGKTLTKFDKRTGKKEDILVFESCHKISFFELSYVFEPADETAVASKVVVAGKHTANPRVPGDDDYEGDSVDQVSRGSWYRDGEPASPVMGENEGHKWMHRQHPYSVDHAVKYEGYEWRPHHDPDEHQDPFDPRIIGAGKYTKEDFAAAGGKKPWETDTADEDAVEIEAMLHTATPTDDYSDWIAEYGEEADREGTHGLNTHFPSWEQKRWLHNQDVLQRKLDFTAAKDLQEIHALFHTAGGICLPGEPCMNRIPQGEQITKDSPNNPVNQPRATGGGGAAGGSSGSAGSSPSKFDISQYKSADDYAKAMNGKNYNYGGHAGDPNGVDCSGYMSDIYSIYSGKPTRFTTDSDFAALGFKPGYQEGAFNIGTNGGTGTGGHMAGTLPDGTKVESNGSNGVQYGGNAIGAQDFDQQWHYPVSSTPATPATGVAPTTRSASRIAMPYVPETRSTQRGNTFPTNLNAEQFMDAQNAPRGRHLDFGAGYGRSGASPDLPQELRGLGYETFEPNPDLGDDTRPGRFVDPQTGLGGGEPTYTSTEDIPDGTFHRIQSANVLNVLEPGEELGERHHAIGEIGRLLAPGGHAVITTRAWKGDVERHAPVEGPRPVQELNAIWTGRNPVRYQKGFDRFELAQQVADHLGDGYTVTPIRIGSAPAVHIVKHPAVEVAATRRKVRSAALKKIARNNVRKKLAWGETEAPMAVDTLREEGTAPEDDDDDFERYVDPPKDLQTPDLSQAQQVDREQELSGATPDQMGGMPGAGDPAAQMAQPQAPQQQYMTLQIPMPSEAPQVPQQAAPPVAAPMPPQDPGMQQQPPQQIAASLLDYFDNYYGRRVANWLDAIEAGRELNPAEAADYRRQAGKLSTLENGRDLSTTNRNHSTKGTATMARSTIASRSKVARAGRRQHFAEGPLVDGGDRSRNDQGEQEEAFISQTPPEVSVDAPTDDTPNISNTEHNLVARVQRGRDQLLRDAQALASLRQRRAFDEAGGPVAEVVDPTVQTGPEGEALTGDDFVSANPNDGVTPTNPKDASLRAFQAFDGWLAQKTGKSSRRHTEATIKKAAAQFSREAGISPQALFPALGIVLREARKNDKQANTKGAKMRKRADEKLEVAAPDGRVDVEAPVANTTDAEAQASQFDLHDFGNNAGDNVAKPDLSTDQNWAPGEASKTSAIKTAGGLLAMRCAEGMIAAGLEPNSRERKYQLAAEFEQMNRGLIQDRVALLERFAAVRQADLRRVASGSSRGAARSPIPAGLGGGTRTASAGPRLAAHDPSNDSSLFI